MSVITIAEKDFKKEVLDRNNETIFIDFWAPWCGPCKSIAPIYEKYSEKYNARFIKINISENHNLSMSLQIKSVPTFVVIKDGSLVATKVGVDNLEDFIKENI